MSVPRPAMFVEIVTAPTAPACGDDPRLPLVVLRVQNLAGDARRPKPRRETFGLLDRERPDEHGPIRCMHAPDLVDHRLLLGLAMGEDEVRLIDADHRPMRRDDDHVEAVQLAQLQRGGLGGAGHAAQARVAAQEMLQRDRSQNPAVGLPLDPFLRLQRRLQSVGPVTIRDDPARELVDHADAAVAHDVVHVAPQEHPRVQRAIELGQHAVVLRVVQAAAAQRTLDLLASGFRQLDVAAVFVGVEVTARRETGDQRSQPRRRRRLASDAAGDDEGTRASSISSESASSTSAKWNGR